MQNFIVFFSNFYTTRPDARGWGYLNINFKQNFHADGCPLNLGRLVRYKCVMRAWAAPHEVCPHNTHEKRVCILIYIVY